MVGMPVTGYLGTSVDTEFFTLFDVTRFGSTSAFLWISEATGLSFEEWEVPNDFLHKDVGGKLVVWIMIVGHVSAALYHHFVKKDQTLIKMLPGKK